MDIKQDIPTIGQTPTILLEEETMLDLMIKAGTIQIIKLDNQQHTQFTTLTKATTTRISSKITKEEDTSSTLIISSNKAIIDIECFES